MLSLASFIVFILLSQFTYNSFGISCINEYGDLVDWWVVYKLPRVAQDPFPNPEINLHLRAGVANNIITNLRDLRMSFRSIDDPLSGPGRTLTQLFQNKNKPGFGHLVFNDDPRDEVTSCSSAKAHAKGVYMWDDNTNTAVWVVHSVPRYPPNPDLFNEYEYPASGTIYGQTLMCVNLRTDQSEQVFQQMQWMKPCFYSSQYTATHQALYPTLVDLMNPNKVVLNPPFIKEWAWNRGSFNFVHYAKNKKLESDIYDTQMRQAERSSLVVATWVNGNAVNLPAACDINYKIYNIRLMSVSGVPFDTKQCHAKWAVTTDSTGWSGNNVGASSARLTTCICDMNRQQSQWTRGGGCLCLRNNFTLWRTYANMITTWEECNGLRSINSTIEEPPASNITNPSMYV